MTEIKCIGENNPRKVLTFVKGKTYAWCESFNGSGQYLIFKRLHSINVVYKHVPTDKLKTNSKDIKLLIELLRKLEKYLSVSEVIGS